MSLVNALTIDVEDYFQVSAFAGHIRPEDWDELPVRVERNIERIFALLEKHRIQATFFTLGWIAERFPAIPRAIVAHGHELASHGYGHRRANEQSAAEFRADVTRAKCLLEDLTGVEVKGYRAPSFSIDHRNLWALDVLAETGHRYSSSIYPVRHDHYGMPQAPRFAHHPRGPQGIMELPATTVTFFGHNFPASGGGWFRLLPYGVSRAMVRRVNLRDGQPAIFFSIPGSWIPSSRALPACRGRRASATT